MKKSYTVGVQLPVKDNPTVRANYQLISSTGVHLSGGTTYTRIHHSSVLQVQIGSSYLSLDRIFFAT